jgi:hypothetical protein
MPGRDGTGPMRARVRAGGGRGRWARPADESASMEDPYQYYGVGWGYWPWDDGGESREGGRSRRFGAGRRSRGRGFRMGKKGTQNPTGSDGTRRMRETFLRRRLEALAAELDRVKALLSECSRGDGEDEK